MHEFHRHDSELKESWWILTYCMIQFMLSSKAGQVNLWQQEVDLWWLGAQGLMGRGTGEHLGVWKCCFMTDVYTG